MPDPCLCEQILTGATPGGWFIRTIPPTDYETYWDCAFEAYRDGVHAKNLQWFSQEDRWGYSCIQYNIMQFYLGLYLATLIRIEWDKGIETDWDYYIEKYGLEEKKHILACFGISLDTILECFELPGDTVETDYEVTYPSSEVGVVFCELAFDECNNC